MAALDVAAVAESLREDRRELVLAIAQGRITLRELTPPAQGRGATVKVVALAQAVPGVGKVRSRHVLDAVGLDASTRWGELDDEEAEALARALDDAKVSGASQGVMHHEQPGDET